MSRSSSLRFMNLLSILGSTLLIVGCFLPFTIWRDGLNQTTSSATSLWISLISTITMPITSVAEIGIAFYAVQMVFLFLFLLSILVPLLIALTGLFNKQQRSFLILGLVFALLGLLEVGLVSFFNFIFEGWCGPEAMSAADCVLVFPGLGLWLTMCGFVLLVGCSIVSVVLHREPIRGEKNSSFATKDK